ncbi:MULTISPECIES: CHY zinc finger protein [unclassified Endozoicomonas]|uniref:CHY zinc finger protein n=1 Tax=unclassified Endozoicomonas TaxID=2644528 RepID=UPI003BB6D9A9
MQICRLFIAFVVSLITIVVVPSVYSSTIIDRHNPDGQRVQIEISDDTDPRDVSHWQVSLLLSESFNDRNSILCFKAPVVPTDLNSIAIWVTNDLSDYCYKLVLPNEKQTPVFRPLSQGASENSALVRLKSTTADRPELISVTTDQPLNDKTQASPLTLLLYPDNLPDIGLKIGQTRNNTITLKGAGFAGNTDFTGGGNGGFFYSPPSPGGGGGRPSGFFEIDLVILKPVINWLMSIGKDSVSFAEQRSPARLKMTRVNADGSSSEAVIPVGWLNFLNIEQLTDVNFWNTLFQRAATTCPASESLQWQLDCLKLFLEYTALKTDHADVLKAGNGDGESSDKVQDKSLKNENNDHQKEKKGAPEDQERNSQREDNDSSGDGNNRKDDNGKESEKNSRTQDLQVLAKQLVAIIESDDPDAVFKLRQILVELNMPLRLQVLETKSTNTEGISLTPLEAILKLQRSFYENSTRNRFIEQLIEATSDKTRTLDDVNIPSELQPIIPPDRTLSEAGNKNLIILYKIVRDIIHRVNQSSQQPPIGQFEKCCFAEYFVQLFLLRSNPLELILYPLGQISDPEVRLDILIGAQSFTLSTSFLYTVTQFPQHPSFHELKHFLNRLLIQLKTYTLPQQPPLQGAAIISRDSTSNRTIASGFADNSLLTRQPYSQPSLPAPMKYTHGLLSDTPAITPGNPSNAGDSPNNQEFQTINCGLEKLETVLNEYSRLRIEVELKRGAQEKQENKRQQIEELTEKVKGLSKENRELRMEAEGLRRQNQALNTDNQGLRSCVSYLQAENECFSKQLEKAQYVLRELRESLNAMPHWAQEPMTAASPPMGSNGAGHSGSYQQSGTHNELATPSYEATNSSNEHSELPSVDDMPHGEQQPISTTSPSKAQSTTSVQKKPMSLCFHYYRLCLLKFDCCRFYFPCHRCHNESDLCEVTNKLPFDAKQFQCSLCKYEGDITENSQKCPGCHQQMSEYFCARCKLFTSSERSMFHCDKCDACHRSKDKLFHCDVCNLCLDINLQSTHKCRQISGRETCCICLEEVPGSRFVLPCSHQVHGECGLAMVQNRLKHCPVCRHPLYP